MMLSDVTDLSGLSCLALVVRLANLERLVHVSLKVLWICRPVLSVERVIDATGSSRTHQSLSVTTALLPRVPYTFWG